MNTWNTQNTQKTAAKQAIRTRMKASTHGTRCWRCSRCQAPAQRYYRACRTGRCAGWLCRAIFRWTFCTCPWTGEQRSDCRDAQIELRGPASTCLKAWKAGERLPKRPASLRVWCNTLWDYGSEAGGTEAWSILDKDRTGSKRTQDGITVLLEFCMRLNR